MSSFRVVILVLLVVALAALGLIYVKMSDRMDLIQQQQRTTAPVAGAAAVVPTPYPMPAPSAGDVAPAVVRDPVLEEELAHARMERERLIKDNEELKRKQAVQEEEKKMQESRDLAKKDPRLQWLNEIKDAELVGRVTEYYRDANLVLFQAVGKPQIKVGQELGIRRRGGIFATLVVDGDDSDGRTFQTYVKRNQLLDANSKEPICAGDEVIIPPASWQADMNSGMAAPAAAPGAIPAGVPPQPETSPAGAPAPAAPAPYVVPFEP